MDTVQIRLLGAMALAGGLLIAYVIVTLVTGTEPHRLLDVLLILIGYLARDATTRVARGNHHADGGAAHNPF